jgi:putative SOS response-associated peptidase YedK
LIPAWAKDNKIGRHTFNARSETASTKPSYRSAWQHRQYGIVLLDDFFEPNYETGRAVKWRIKLASVKPMGIACLWDRWDDPATGERVVSFSMLTTNADQHHIMCQFHPAADEKRTPVVLAEQQFGDWLSATSEQAAGFMNWSQMPELVAAPALAT